MGADAGLSLALADVVLVAHALLALFLSLGVLALWTGGWLGWGWTRRRGFRVPHLVGMVVVAGESLAGIVCPLTDLESALRISAGAAGYRGGFIAHWLGRLLFYDFDERVFAAAYVAALALTLWAWRKWPSAAR